MLAAFVVGMGLAAVEAYAILKRNGSKRLSVASRIWGPDTVLGLWLSSVNRIARYFLLSPAVVTAATGLSRLVANAIGFLAAAQCAGRERW